ncbi:hypothetical protein KIH27_17560, partial [Mycobacterium sp. M1]
SKQKLFQSNLNQKHQSKTDIQKHHTPNTGRQECGKKQQQTKTTKHTIEFSNNTPCGFFGRFGAT